MSSLTRADFDEPLPVSAVQKAFPANVMDSYLPPREWYREDNVPRAWEDFAQRLFFGQNVSDIALIPAGVDSEKAWEHATMILRSYEPSHEHKIEGVAWLLWHWFEQGQYRYHDEVIVLTH